jgi:uncharacterized membrane protein YoaT (DUF817 family)
MEEASPEVKAALQQMDKYGVRSVLCVICILFAIAIALASRLAEGSESRYVFSVIIGFVIVALFVLAAWNIAEYVGALRKYRQVAPSR